MLLICPRANFDVDVLQFAYVFGFNVDEPDTMLMLHASDRSRSRDNLDPSPRYRDAVQDLCGTYLTPGNVP